MQNISLNDGTIISIDSDKDIIEIISENCSYELANILDYKLKNIEAENIYAEKLALTDADDYLSELEKKEDCLKDILDIIQNLNNEIENSSNIDKKNLCEKLNKIVQIIGY